MKYFPTLVRQLKFCAMEGDPLTRSAFKQLLEAMESDHTKRMIFDARQAKVFDQSAEIDERRREKIFPPFRNFYLELTEPIELNYQEPGCKDVLWAILYRQNVGNVTEVINKGQERRNVCITKVTFFYKSLDDAQFIDRTWSMSPEGYPMAGRPPKEVTKRWQAKHVEGAEPSALITPELLPDYVKEGEMVSVFECKKFGWWENTLLANTNLLYWIFAYTMAKSVTIVEIPDTRQVRRAREREGRIPNPWHVVRVEPKRVVGGVEYVGDSGIKHSYRYDVIGHLRFNRHKTKDGYKDTIEWVADHQRGLENELYIPKTYKVEKDKKIAVKEMNEYMDGPNE